VLLQTLSTRDFDELAEAFPRWDLRFRQLGRGPFRGRLHFLQLEGVQVFRLSVNRLIHVEGWPPAGSFGCAPVVAANANAIWRGQSLKVGQVRRLVPGQGADHLTAAHNYQVVALTLDADLVRQEVLGGFDLKERLLGKDAVTRTPAYCRALWSHLVGLLDLAQARPDLPAPAERWIEEECLRRFAGLLARPNDDRTARQPSNRAQLIRRAEEYLRANLQHPLSLFDICRELAVNERTLHYAFQELRGLSPMAYVKSRRLNAVRQELKTAPAGTTTVHEIAQRWGFWHTGEFAADYRRLFGELPSQTFNG
jgi:AraC family ethanolamine operon transcriptional activator